MSTDLNFDYRIHHSTRGCFDRPVEEYVLARITIQEELARLTEVERQAAVMGACGFQMVEWAEVRGISDRASAKNRRRALALLATEQQPKPVAVMCSECGKEPVKLMGKCRICYGRSYYRIHYKGKRRNRGRR